MCCPSSTRRRTSRYHRRRCLSLCRYAHAVKLIETVNLVLGVVRQDGERCHIAHKTGCFRVTHYAEPPGEPLAGFCKIQLHRGRTDPASSRLHLSKCPRTPKFLVLWTRSRWAPALLRCHRDHSNQGPGNSQDHTSTLQHLWLPLSAI